MAGKAGILFMGILLIIVSGCTGRPVFSVEVDSTSTPYELYPDSSPVVPNDLTITASPSPLPPATTIPAFTLAPAALPADFSPILYGKKYDSNTFFFLLGGVRAGKWITPEQAANLITGTTEYDIHTSRMDMFQVLGYAAESTPIRPGQYTVGSDSTRADFGMLGVAHGWPVRQGQAEELSPDNETYKQVALDWLKDAGVADPQLGTLHIYRVDLEDDGPDEIFISATHLDDSQHTTRKGDYSIVLMRKVAGNEAVTMPLVADIYRSQEAESTYPRTYLLSNFIDLNQDGILEVVIDYHRWEEDGAILYTVHGQESAQVP
jgi:hypothetical protein